MGGGMVEAMMEVMEAVGAMGEPVSTHQHVALDGTDHDVAMYMMEKWVRME